MPAALDGRAEAEIAAFFAAWSAALLHALLRRPYRTAWREQFTATGVLLCLVPFLNALTGGAHLGASLPGGLWQAAGFDLMAMAFGALFLFAARQTRTRLSPDAANRENA